MDLIQASLHDHPFEHMMKRRLVVEFTKMNGAGNDFIVIDNRFYYFSDEELSELAAQLCRRRFGIGADGLLAFSPARDEVHHFRMRYFNADGSVGTMCGNGARCLARFARRAGIEDEEMTFETDAGLYRAFVPADERSSVRLHMPPPRDFSADKQLDSQAAQDAGNAHYIWTGTEHLVCFVPDIDAVPVAEWGPLLRKDAGLGPAGANVDFVQVVSDHLRARTFEKGVEQETLACGTGAVASAVVAHLMGLTAAEPVQVRMPGGTLTVGFRAADGSVTDLYLEGPAEAVFRGTVEI